jgi:hypothetical protein
MLLIEISHILKGEITQSKRAHFDIKRTRGI